MIDPIDPIDRDVEDAERTVQIARDRLRATQKDFMNHWRGAADVHNAEHSLSTALDQLDYVRGLQRTARLNGAA